ncbi:MAG: hypothetical protein O6704_06390 [Nitrospinae bacterium]|nr:hypothetical protein [Nitrospinota bacterium]
MDKESVEQELLRFEEKVDRIVGFFDSRGHISRNAVAEVQSLFRELKEDLKSEYKSMDTIRGQASLSDIEDQFYQPAIRDAWANTRISSIPWNSQPNQQWCDVLIEVSDYMSYWRNNLKSH